MTHHQFKIEKPGFYKDACGDKAEVFAIRGERAYGCDNAGMPKDWTLDGRQWGAKVPTPFDLVATREEAGDANAGYGYAIGDIDGLPPYEPRTVYALPDSLKRVAWEEAGPSTAQQPDKRTRFESWIMKETAWGIRLTEDERSYSNPYTSAAWEGWKARAPEREAVIQHQAASVDTLIATATKNIMQEVEHSRQPYMPLCDIEERVGAVIKAMAAQLRGAHSDEEFSPTRESADYWKTRHALLMADARAALEIVTGTLQPIADVDWYGKWRIREVIDSIEARIGRLRRAAPVEQEA